MFRHLAIAIGVVATVATLARAVSGQPKSIAPFGIDALIAEVRGLRADLNQSSAPSIRTQLLVGRLQLQDQRINAIDFNERLDQIERDIASAGTDD